LRGVISTASPAEELAGRRPIEVLVLSRPDCALCDHAKAVLERVDRDFVLQICELDLDSEESEALARNVSVLFPPAVFLDGKLFCYGRLSERRLRRELKNGAAGYV